MIRRLPHLALALIALTAVVAPAALASSAANPKKHHKGPSNCVSAVCVYVEQYQAANGSRVVGTGTGRAVGLSAYAAERLARLGGKDRRELQAIGTLGVQQPESGASSDVSSPSTLLAAFDLGAGPLALFATLLAGAAAFGVGSALRRRRRSS